jgi:hypothetical protein
VPIPVCFQNRSNISAGPIFYAAIKTSLLPGMARIA